MTSLSEAPDTYELPESDEERERFRIDGPGKAAWAMRKLRDLARQRLDIQRVAEDEIARVEAWATREDDALARDARYFEGLLQAYALEQRAADPRCKNVSTPFGRVTTRAGAKWEVVDVAAVLDWARRARPELVKTEESLRLADAKKALAVEGSAVVDPATAEVVPGITVAAETITATVVPDVTS